MNNLPVYDVVLLLPNDINQTAITISSQVARYGTEFTLSDNLYPHISLYMANFTSTKLIEAQHLLSKIARDATALTLQGSHWGKNDQGMLEIFFQRPLEIAHIQERVIAALNPLRHGLRVKDPVGRLLEQYRHQAPDEARAHIEQYGYDEIGTFFKPHITITRFKQRSTPIDTTLMPSPATFSGIYNTLALCEMGEHGTCTQIVARFTLLGKDRDNKTLGIVEND